MLLGKGQLSCSKLKKLKFPCSGPALSLQLKEQVGSGEVGEDWENWISGRMGGTCSNIFLPFGSQTVSCKKQSYIFSVPEHFSVPACPGICRQCRWGGCTAGAPVPGLSRERGGGASWELPQHWHTRRAAGAARHWRSNKKLQGTAAAASFPVSSWPQRSLNREFQMQITIAIYWKWHYIPTLC